MSVISFGVNKQSQLGQDTLKDHLDPSVIQHLKGKRIVQVACGEAHSIGITEFGDVYSWGRGREGELGHPERQAFQNPQIIKALEHERIVKVACGNFHSLALTDTGKVYEWGQLHEIDFSQKGIDTRAGLVEMRGIGFANKIAEESLSLYLNGEKKAYTKEKQTIDPQQHQQNDQDEQDDENNTLNYEELTKEDLTNKNEEYDENDQSNGKQIGKIVDKNQNTPRLIESLKGKKIIDISAGWAYSAAVTSDGALYTWGFNEKGQLGLGDRWFHGTPQKVKILSNVHIKSVSCGRQHIGAISTNGDLYMWGLGVFGQLGHGKTRSYLRPKLVLAFTNETSVANPINKKVKQVACGANFTMVVTEDGALYSFGHGEYGQLGATEDIQHMDWNRGEDGEEHLKFATPARVEALKNVVVKLVACGHLHTLVVTEDNDVYSWGWGSSGCLGFGDKKFQLVPQRVPALSGEMVSSISGGEKHSLVVRSSDISTFAFDYKNLLNDQKQADYAIMVQSKFICINKFFIKSRCPRLYGTILLDEKFVGENGLYTTIVLPDLSEKKLRYIEIKNGKHQIWVAFLTYLYTDHLVIAPHLRNELSILANQWGVPRLASLCHRYNYKLRLTDKIPPSTFSQEITQHLDSFDFSDIHFKLTNTEVVPSHKLILSSRNQYFKTMFECGFKEKDQLDFKVGNDIGMETFKLMIEYIYGSSDSIVNQDNAVDLLCLADRFMVEDLKLVAEHYLEQMVKSNIACIKSYINGPQPSSNASEDDGANITLEDAITSFDNVCLLLEISDRFMARRLKRVCMESMIAEVSPTIWKTLNINQTIKNIKLLRELDHFATVNSNIFSANQIMALSR